MEKPLNIKVPEEGDFKKEIDDYIDGLIHSLANNYTFKFVPYAVTSLRTKLHEKITRTMLDYEETSLELKDILDEKYY